MAKPPWSVNETVRSALQNGPFCNAERTVLAPAITQNAAHIAAYYI